MLRKILFSFILLLACSFTACSGYGYRLKGSSSYHAKYYLLESSETLASISEKFSIPLDSLVWLNGIAPNSLISKGNSILLSYGGGKGDLNLGRSFSNNDYQRARLASIPSPTLNDELYLKDKLYWPLKSGRLVSGFGPRGSSFHDGVDIAAPKGTSIYSATSGKVIYAGNGLKGYGNLVIVKDSNSSLAVYAHCSKIFVNKREAVYKGDKIAEVGSSGRSSGPHLHFEIRVKKQGQGYIAVDPLAFFGTSGRKVGYRNNDTLTPLVK